MGTRTLYCEVCSKPTPHQVDGDSNSDDGELALCTLCGRLTSLSHDTAPKTPPRPDGAHCRR